MRIGALISGGKDSLFAAYQMAKEHEITCFIAIKSRNPESYMFHIPNIDLVNLQSEAAGIPLILLETEGVKEAELRDLYDAVEVAKKKYDIKGIVSGAIMSKYQKTRIEDICRMAMLKSFTPIWQTNIQLYLQELLKDFEIIISGIAVEGLDETDLGKRFDLGFVEKAKKFKINPVGEGGEFETFVLNCPLFKKRIKVEYAERVMENKYAGQYVIKKAILV